MQQLEQHGKMLNMVNPKEKRKYWYQYYIEECVLCGKQRIFKRREYDFSSDKEKTIYNQFACDHHFM